VTIIVGVVLIGVRNPMIFTALWPLLVLVKYFHAICMESLQSASGMSAICNNSKMSYVAGWIMPDDTHAANRIRKGKVTPLQARL